MWNPELGEFQDLDFSLHCQLPTSYMTLGVAHVLPPPGPLHHPLLVSASQAVQGELTTQCFLRLHPASPFLTSVLIFLHPIIPQTNAASCISSP